MEEEASDKDNKNCSNNGECKICDFFLILIVIYEAQNAEIIISQLKQDMYSEARRAALLNEERFLNKQVNISYIISE